MTTGVAKNLQPAARKLEPIPGYAWLVMSMPWLFIAVGAMLNYAIGVMLPSMQAEIGFGPAQAGWLSGISWILTAVLSVPITFIVNKYGPKMIIGFVLFAAGAFIVLNGASHSYAMLFVSRAIALSLVVALTPTLALLKNQWVPITRIVSLNGVEGFISPAGQMLATAAVPTLLVVLAGWRNVFYVFGGIVLVLAVCWVIFPRERRTEAYEAARKAGGGMKDFTAAAKHSAIYVLAFGWIGVNLTWIAFFTFWPTYATDVMGMSLTQAGIILAVFSIGGMVAALVTPIVCEKVGVDKPFIWAWGFLLPIFYYGMLPFKGMLLTGLFAFLAGFGAFSFIPPGISLPFKLKGIKPNEVSMALGILIVIVSVGAALGGIVPGSIFQATGSLHTALVVCCLTPLTLGILGLFLPERGRKALERDAAAPTPS